MKKICLALLLVFAFSRGGSAQSLGTINGNVTDPTGAVVGGATVTATNAGTQIARSAVTNGAGEYSIPALTPGIYNVTAEATGFAKFEKEHQTLVTGSTLTVSFKLGLASTSEKVEVSTDVPMVELTQSMAAGTLQTSEVESLPIANRSFNSMVSLVPGTHLNPAPNPAKSGEVGGVSFGGAAGRSGATALDGGVFRDDVYGGSLFNLSLEGVQEFSVLTHDYGAEYGMTSGGIVLITTKAGTNSWHGSAFAYGRSDGMTAIDYFSSPANGGLGKPPYDREQWGGSLGLPIVKDKLFVFGAFERTAQDQATTFPSIAYTQVQALKTALTALTSCATCVLVGNAIVPAPNIPGSLSVNEATARLDYQINTRHSLFFRWIDEHVNNYNNEGGTAPDIDPNGSNYTEKSPADSGILSEIWVVNNKTVNTAAITANHFYLNEQCHCTLTGANLTYRNMSFPDLSVGGDGNTGPSKEFETILQIKDTFSRQQGTHALKFGGDFIDYPRVGTESAAASAGSAPSVSFFDDPSVITTNTTTYPQGFLTPGAMSSMVVSAYAFGGGPSHSFQTGAKEWSLFFQDDWKVKRNLTLNLGLRYSRDINFKNDSIQNQNLDRSLQSLILIGSPWGAHFRTPILDFSPRVGFAWNPDGKGMNVIRGSFGIYFDEALFNIGGGLVAAEQPYLADLSTTYANTSVGKGPISNFANAVYGETAIETAILPGPLANTPNAIASFAPGASNGLSWLDPNFTDPRSVQWHAGYTRQLTHSTVVSADYSYILGLHEVHPQSINPTESLNWDPNTASYNTCGLTGSYRRLECAFEAAFTTANLPALAAKNTIGAVSITTTGGVSKYNEFTLHFEQRSRRVTLQGTYTLAYADSFGGTTAGSSGGGAATASEIPFQWHSPSEWGPSGTDERHRGVVSGVFNLPWAMTVSPIFQVGSPRPYTCKSGVDWTGSGFGTGARCLMNASGTLVTAKGLPAGPLPAGDTPVAVNSLRGTSTWDFDTRFTKIFTIRERLKANIFVELYNITNKVNFGSSYQGTFTSATFEQPTGLFNSGGSLSASRQLQLGARFTF